MKLYIKVVKTHFLVLEFSPFPFSRQFPEFVTHQPFGDPGNCEFSQRCPVLPSYIRWIMKTQCTIGVHMDRGSCFYMMAIYEHVRRHSWNIHNTNTVLIAIFCRLNFSSTYQDSILGPNYSKVQFSPRLSQTEFPVHLQANNRISGREKIQNRLHFENGLHLLLSEVEFSVQIDVMPSVGR